MTMKRYARCKQPRNAQTCVIEIRNRDRESQRAGSRAGQKSGRFLIRSDLATRIHCESGWVEIKGGRVAIFVQERVEVEILKHVVRGKRVGEVHITAILSWLH